MMWLIIGLFFIVLYILSINDNYKKIPLTIRKVFYGIFGFFAVAFIIVEIMILSKYNNTPKNDLDYLIVLGAQVTSDGPTIAYKYRLDAAYDYLINNKNTRCVLTGGKNFNEPISEGEGGYNYLIERGIEEKRLSYESTSTNTYENINNAIELIDDVDNKAIGIVTNKYHLFRGMSLAKKILNKDVDGVPADINKFYLLNSLFREFFGVVKDIWKIL